MWPDKHCRVTLLQGCNRCQSESIAELRLSVLAHADDPGREPSWFESLLVGKGSNLALAILCSKFCVPIKVPMAVAITPYVHRWVIYMA